MLRSNSLDSNDNLRLLLVFISSFKTAFDTVDRKEVWKGLNDVEILRELKDYRKDMRL